MVNLKVRTPIVGKRRHNHGKDAEARIMSGSFREAVYSTRWSCKIHGMSDLITDAR